MIRLIPAMLCLLLLAPPALASDTTHILEEVSRHYAAGQPGLLAYEVKVEPSKLEEMIEEMTANMPAELPRPEAPVLRKYWSRKADRAIILMEAEQSFPYMVEMVRRFSSRFNIELRNFFMQPKQAKQRDQLLAGAKIKTFESQVESRRNLHLNIDFGRPIDLGEAFYRQGLGIPAESILSLAFELDPEEKLVRRLEIVTASQEQYLVEVRYQQENKTPLPQEIRITTADGRIDDRFETTFLEVDGHLLPARQVRSMRHGSREETITVDFSDYRLNPELPIEIRRQLETDQE